MRKTGFLLSLFLLFGTFFALCLKNVNAQNGVFAENNEIMAWNVTPDFDGDYTLNSDYYFPSSGLGDFAGEFNGNGHTIYIKSADEAYNYTLFDSLNGAKIYNLTIRAYGSDEVIFNIGESDKNWGIVAKYAESTTFSNVQIKNISVICPSTTVPLINIGTVVGEADQGSSFEQIVVDNCEFVGSNDGRLLSDVNMGFVVGKAESSTIKNCTVTNVYGNFTIGATTHNIFNFGGLAGYIENMTLFNNIINLYSLNGNNLATAFNINSDTEKNIYFGGLAGQITAKESLIYNNAVLFDQSNILVQTLTVSASVGSMFGGMEFELDSTRISGFLTSYNGEYVGTGLDGDDDYLYLNIVPYSGITLANFYSLQYLDNLWKDHPLCNWDFDKIWMRGSDKLPVLQYFQTYSANFSVQDSILTLSMGTTIVGNVVSGEMIVNDESGVSVNNIEYGETLHVRVSIESTNNYNLFFKIVGLMLDGSQIYSNVTETSLKGFDVTFENEDGTYVYSINNFNANCAGEYYVLLEANTYKLNVMVYDTDDATDVGEFRTSINSELTDNYVIDMRYGGSYSVTSYATDDDYSDSAFWFLYDSNQSEEFNPKGACNANSSKLEWVFNENCILFSNDVYKFDLSDYHEDEEKVSNFNLYLTFEKNVKTIIIGLKYANDDDIEEKVIDISIDGKTNRITWDEENKCFIAKIAYTVNEEHVIKIDSINKKGYTFDYWQIEIEKIENEENSDYSAIFNLAASADEDIERGEVMQIYCVFKNPNRLAGNLLWLWIVLGALVACGVTLIIVFVVRRRSAGGKSYKKYYY